MTFIWIFQLIILYLNRLSMYCLGDGPHTRNGYRRYFQGNEAKTIGFTLEELDRIVADRGKKPLNRQFPSALSSTK